MSYPRVFLLPWNQKLILLPWNQNLRNFGQTPWKSGILASIGRSITASIIHDSPILRSNSTCSVGTLEGPREFTTT